MIPPLKFFLKIPFEKNVKPLQLNYNTFRRKNQYQYITKKRGAVQKNVYNKQKTAVPEGTAAIVLI